MKIYDAMDPVAKYRRQTDNLNGYAAVIHRPIEVSIHGFPFEQNRQPQSLVRNVRRTIRPLALLTLIGGSGFCEEDVIDM